MARLSHALIMGQFYLTVVVKVVSLVVSGLLDATTTARVNLLFVKPETCQALRNSFFQPYAITLFMPLLNYLVLNVPTQ